MKPALQIAPLALLLAGSAIAVWRGMDTKSDKTPNRTKASGRKWKFWQ